MESLSELPEGVLHHIVSYLTAKEVIPLSLSSKQFLEVVRTRRALVFDLERRPRNGDVEKKRYRKALDHAWCTLDRYHREGIGLEAFTLMANPSFQGTRLVGSHYQCIESAVKKNLKSLHLCYFFALPSSLCSSKTLEQLSLHCCVLMEVGGAMWPNLKRLHLENVSFDGEAFENMIKASPLVEILEIKGSCQHQTSNKFSFLITNLHNLKQLNAELSNRYSVEVDEASSLEFVRCVNSSQITTTTASSCGQISFCKPEYSNLKSLKVFNVGIDGNFSTISVDWTQKFPQLEELSIQGYENLERINVSSRSLKKIKLMSIHNLQEAHFDVPSFATFDYKDCGYHGRNILPKLSFTGVSGRWISRINLECKKTMYALWLVQLNEFLQALKGSEISVFVYFERNVIFDTAGGGQATCSASVPPVDCPTREIQEFFIQERDFSLLSTRPIRRRKESLSSTFAILRGVLWICRPQTITFRFLSDYSYPKLFYDVLVLKGVDLPSEHSNFKVDKSWNVTGIEIFQVRLDRNKIHYSKRERRLQLSQPLADCQTFFKALETYNHNSQRSDDIAISFNLEWSSSNSEIVTWSREDAKRLKRSH